MASRPDEPPESIILGEFTGLRNNVAPERLKTEDLQAAVNVDLDDAGQLRRRRGYARKIVGAFHSVTTLPRGTLAVKDGSIGWVLPGYTFVVVQSGIGPEPVAALQIGDEVYFSSLTNAGIIHADDAVEAWAVPASATRWLSPAISPTDTAGAIAGKLISPPPTASDMTAYNGRIYLAVDKILWATELYLYRFVDRTKGFIPFETAITMVAAVDDGIYVGTEQGIFFLKGAFSSGMKLEKLSGAAAVRGFAVSVPGNKVIPQRYQGTVPESTAVVFMTSEGICAGFNGGQLFNLTHEKMEFPAMSSAAVLYREQDGVNQLVAVADSGGSPTSTARIGDYVDAEIRRFQGG